MSITIHESKSTQKMKRHPTKHLWPNNTPSLEKPSWLRKKIFSVDQAALLIEKIQKSQLHSVCQEASCPNLGECFSHGVATFMILGKNCTRRCSFCDVGHAYPDPVDVNEPDRLAQIIADMKLKYVVITSVDRDDLLDGGASHFRHCIDAIYKKCPNIAIEVLVPDFRGRQDKALASFQNISLAAFNHNIETVPRLYKPVRPGSDYAVSLELLRTFKQQHPHILTKSGIMVGLGETCEEIYDVFSDLRLANVDLLTIGQYLQPSPNHYPLLRYYTPEEFENFAIVAKDMGFKDVASGPFVRSSYQADRLVLHAQDAFAIKF